MPPPKDPEKREQWIVKKRVDAIERWANPEQRKKMVEGMNRPETKAKKSASMQGKNTGPKSEEHKANLSVSGKIAMNRVGVKKKRSISAKIAMNRPEVKEKLSGDKNSSKRPEVRKKLSISHQGKRHSEETKVKIGVSSERMWQDPKWKEKQLKLMFKGLKLLPNKPEKFLGKLLQGLFPNLWRYTGNGSFWITSDGKHLNPDFVYIDQKKIIEHFGDYHHGEKVTGVPNDQHEQERIDLFAQHGYQTLIIWEHELKDVNILQEKLLVFMGK